MADEVNKSKNSSLNNSFPGIDESSVLTELERIGQRINRPTIRSTNLNNKLRSEGKLLNQLIDDGKKYPIIKEGPVYNEQVSALRQSISTNRGRMNALRDSNEVRAESEASSIISRQFEQSTINSEITAAQKGSSIQNRALSMANIPYDELDTRKLNIMSAVRSSERDTLSKTKGLFSTPNGLPDVEKSSEINVALTGKKEKIDELAAISAAQQFQKINGQDPASQRRKIIEAGRQANQVLSSYGIGNDIKGANGGVAISEGGISRSVSQNEINSEMINQAKKLSDALKKLTDGVEQTEEQLAELKETSENFNKLQSADKLIPSGQEKTQNTVSTLNNISQGFGILGQTGQSLMIDQRMGQLNNTAGFANLANERYNTYRQARAGDVASQHSLLDEQNASKFSTEMVKATNLTNLAYGVGSAAQTAAGGIKLATTLNPIENTTSTAQVNAIRQDAVLQTVSGVAGMAIRANDYDKNITASQNQIAAQSMGIEARKALRYVSSSQAQGLRDYSVGLGEVGMNMGNKSSSFIEEAGSDAMLEKFISAGMSPEQFVNSSKAGIAGMGNAFASSSVISSRNLERGGFGSTEKNLQRMSSLAQAGSNNPEASLASVLESAVASGLNSSTALDMVVKNTAETVSAVSQASGIDTISAKASLIAGTVDQDLAAKNDIFAAQRATSVQQKLSDIANDTSVSYSGMLNTANISQKTGLSTKDSAFAGQLDIATLKQLASEKDENKIDEALLGMGVDYKKGNKGSAKDFVNTLIPLKTTSTIVGAGGLELDNTGGKTSASLADKLQSGEEITSRSEKQLAGQLGVNQGITGGEFIRGVGAFNKADIGGDDIKKTMKGDIPNSPQTVSDDLRVSGFKQMSEAAATASKELGGFTKAISTFVALQKTFEKDGKQNESSYSGMSEKMASTFNASTEMFREGAGDFKAAVEKFEKLQGLKSDGNAISMPDSVNKLSEKITGKAR